MDRIRIERKLERAGFKILKSTESLISLKYRPRKDFYSIVKNLKLPLQPNIWNQHFDCKPIVITWDIESIADYISKFGIDRSKISFWYLSCGELPISTRRFRKTYTIGKSIKSLTKKRKSSYTIRPLIVDIGKRPYYIARKAAEIVRKNHLKNYSLVLAYKQDNYVIGGFIGAGGLIKD